MQLDMLGLPSAAPAMIVPSHGHKAFMLFLPAFLMSVCQAGLPPVIHCSANMKRVDRILKEIQFDSSW